MIRYSAFILILLMPVCLCFASSDVLPEVTGEEAFSLEEEEDKSTERAWGVLVIGLLMAGFILLLVEVLLLPGFEVTGITGVILLLVGVTISAFTLSIRMTIAVSITSFMGIILICLWLYYIFPKTNAGKQFILQDKTSKEMGYIAVDDKSAYIGVEGVTTTMLRPSGFINVDDERLDVTSDCEFVEKGVRVKVVKISNSRLIVVPVKEDNR